MECRSSHRRKCCEANARSLPTISRGQCRVRGCCPIRYLFLKRMTAGLAYIPEVGAIGETSCGPAGIQSEGNLFLLSQANFQVPPGYVGVSFEQYKAERWFP